MLALIIAIPKEVNPTITPLYWVFPIYTLLALFCVWFLCYFFIQFTILTEEGIKVRCLWCTIRKLTWEEVKEVRLESFYVSVEGFFSSKWYLFDDGEQRIIKNGLVNKKTHITLNYSKRAK